MKFTQRQFRFLGPVCFGIVMVSSLGGCAESNLPGPTGTVNGVATYNGEPIPAGSAIVFVHSQTGIMGSGLTDSDGRFEIQMRDDNQVLVGKYAVTVAPPGRPDENINILTVDNVPEAWKKVPKKYWGQSSSGEIFTVAEGANEYQFELTD